MFKIRVNRSINGLEDEEASSFCTNRASRMRIPINEIGLIKAKFVTVVIVAVVTVKIIRKVFSLLISKHLQKQALIYDYSLKCGESKYLILCIYG